MKTMFEWNSWKWYLICTNTGSVAIIIVLEYSQIILARNYIFWELSIIKMSQLEV